MIIFHNPGEIDIRGATIAGLSAKENDSPIGYFGTGLKYSIACILRWDGTIEIYSGKKRYTFDRDSIQFRNQSFQQITMNGENLGFTTEYGKNWEPWHVFRELYANARDEGGSVFLDDSSSHQAEGHTHILVNCPQLIEAFHDRDNIILPANMQWAHENPTVQFRATESAGLYYRGVKVLERPGLFTWNILGTLGLTEDRTLRHAISASSYIDNFVVANLHDVEVIMKLLEVKYSTDRPMITTTVEVEGQAVTRQRTPLECDYMDWFSAPTRASDYQSAEYKEACVRLYQRDPQIYRGLRSFVKSIDESLIAINAHKLSPREQLMFDKAKELVALFGFEEEIARLPIHVQELGGQTLGLYEHGTVYLSPKLFDQGTKQLVATLYEECYHHRTANTDCTYNMQSDLFNIIISLNEELHKVIC